MADVQIQQPDSGSSTAVVWAIVVIALLAIIAWFLFARGGAETTDLDVDINTPGQTTPPPSGDPPPSP